MTSVPPMAALPADLEGHEPVAEYATGLQNTRVLRAPDGVFRWWQQPGHLHQGPFTAPAADVLPEQTDEWDAALLALPRQAGDGLLFEAHGAASAAAWTRDFRPAARLLVAGALASAARGLRVLHRGTGPAQARTGPPPPGLLRLRAWAESDGELRRRAREAWGRRRTESLLGWADQATDEAASGTVHGWASLGSLVPPLHRGRTVLLTGPDLGTGRPELDLGWIVGELAEIAWRIPSYDTAGLRRVFLDAYGAGPDPVLTGRCAVLRIAVHTQDFARFQGWDDELLEYLGFIADLIDHEGRPALSPTPGDDDHDTP